jgi:hypothetical protein
MGKYIYNAAKRKVSSSKLQERSARNYSESRDGGRKAWEPHLYRGITKKVKTVEWAA